MSIKIGPRLRHGVVGGVALALGISGLPSTPWVSSQWACAYAQAPSKQKESQIPKGFEGYFDEVAKAANKYPGAAERFGIWDQSTDLRHAASVRLVLAQFGVRNNRKAWAGREHFGAGPGVSRQFRSRQAS